MERTLVVIKPDAVERGIIGDIIRRFERVGLKVIAAKMFKPTKALANQHYPKNRKEFITGLGKNTLKSYAEQNIDVKKQFGSDDPHKIGLSVQQWLADSITSVPVLALVLEAPHAIEVVRKLCGTTLPTVAQPGTIRGDYSFDSPALANANNRTIRNLIHASGNRAEAKHEIKLWFKPAELFDYHSVHQHHMTS